MDKMFIRCNFLSHNTDIEWMELLHILPHLQAGSPEIESETQNDFTYTIKGLKI